MNAYPFKGKHALVTGGTKGMGPSRLCSQRHLPSGHSSGRGGSLVRRSFYTNNIDCYQPFMERERVGA
jgi:hypothetical protein